MNLLREFLALIPDDPVLYVEVKAHNGDGTATVELPSGSQFRVRGTSVAVNDHAYVQGGRILGAAPALPSHQVTIF